MFCVTPSMSHNKEAGMTTPTWSLPFCTQNHLLHAVPQGIHCLIVTATTSNTVASLDTILWLTPTVPPLRAKHLLASDHRDNVATSIHPVVGKHSCRRNCNFGKGTADGRRPRPIPDLEEPSSLRRQYCGIDRNRIRSGKNFQSLQGRY